MDNPQPNFYEVLKISEDSSPEEIRKAYKTLVKKWHPDKHPISTKSEAEAMFKAITEAYEALNDKEQRRMFRVQRNNMVTSSPGLNQAKPGSKEFKNRSYSLASSIRRKPPPVVRKLECSLEDLCWGCEKEIKFTRDVVTKNGLVIQNKESCIIAVKPGWKKGTRITFEGMGDEQPGCLPADLVFLISEKKHPLYKRSGNDLVLKVEVSLVNALTGWSFSFRLLDGKKMSCSFPDEIIFPGYEKVIKGHGMPLAHENDGARGDLRIKFHVTFPLLLTKQQKLSIAMLLKDSI